MKHSVWLLLLPLKFVVSRTVSLVSVCLSRWSTDTLKVL
jgi:hypothetical protein